MYLLYVSRIIYAAADGCFLYIQKPYILYFSNFRINSDVIFCFILERYKISRQSICSIIFILHSLYIVCMYKKYLIVVSVS